MGAITLEAAAARPPTRSRGAAATVDQTISAINDACKRRGGKYREYSCKAVSWDDVSRGTVGGSLSCWGPNITDTYLKSKTGVPLFTVRSDNWNEKLGHVRSSDVAVVAGAGGPQGELQPRTLQRVLKELGSFGSYAKLAPGTDLSNDRLDALCSIRFQTTFLPVDAAGTMEFATEAYNYNTMSDADPRNLVLLCTSQGVAVQQDGAGAKRLFHHAVDGDGRIHRYWLEAESSRHKVGGAQHETAAERAAALARGKATASVIGIRAMGERFNALMTIQVPLQQRTRPARWGGSWGGGGYNFQAMDCCEAECAPACAAPPVQTWGAMAQCEAKCASAAYYGDCRKRSLPSRCAPPPVGTARAARVSRGSEADVWEGLTLCTPCRHPSEHVTITVVLYNTVAGGVPSEHDVIAAIDDLENLYQACSSGHLADHLFAFTKEQLTPTVQSQIATKIACQPYIPPVQPVHNFSAFPV